MMLKAVGNYMKRSSINNGNTQGEGETVMEKLKKQQSKEEGEDSPRTEDYNRADDFKVFRAANDFHENEDFVTVVQVDENERFDPRMGNWSGAHLHPSDPSKYKSTIGHTNIFPEIEAPEGMQFMGSWEVDESLGFEGWMYGTNFLDLDLGKYTKPNVRTTVRRRRWIRKVAQLPTQEEIKSVSVDRTESPVLPIQTGDDDNLPSSASPKPKSNLSSIFGETNTSDKRSASPTPSPAPASTTTPNITVSENFADNFEFDYEEDIKDNESIMSESVRLPGEGQRPQSMKLSGQPAPAKRFSWFGSSTATTSSPSTAAPPEPKQSLDPTLRVRGTTLTAIGKQIKFIEGESKKEDEVRQQRWKDVTKPQLERRIIELDKKILELKNIIERDAKDPTRGGMDNLSKLDDQLNQTTEQLDATKRELYFPFTKITLGQGGVYLAMDDFWLEYASGAFFLELCPNKKFPEINFKLFGTKQSEHNGVMARLKVEGFRLAGDKGKSVPKLKFDSLMVTIAFNFSTCLQYDFQKSKWFIDPKQFQVNILSFKGPYGLNRSIVSFVLSLLTPMIRNLLLKDLPFELGLLVRTLSSPVTMEGHFDIKGTNVRSLSLDLFKNEIFMKLCDYSPLQMEMFYWLQKALERSNVMKSAADLISYIRTYSIDGAIWRQLINLWAVATQMYCEKVALAKADQSSPGVVIKGAGFTLPQFTIHFEKFLEAADNLLSKRIGVNFTLTQIDGQVSLNHFLSFAFQIIHRVFTDAVAKATSVEKVRLMNTLEKMKISYQTSLEVLKFISKNLDFVQLTVTVDAHAGSEGIVAVTVEDILAQAPILLNLAIKEDKNIGVLPLVPYIVGMKPQENGDINLEIYHFSHDSFESPVVAAPPPTLQATPSSSSAPDPSSNGSGGSFSSSLNNSNHISSALAPPLVATQTLSSIQTGHFCTSYNKVVTNITSGKVFPRNTSSFYRREEIHKYMEIPFTTEHLEVKSEEQKRLMEEVLADMPHGDEADTVMTVSATSPHISVIVDHSITLKPGAELFTMVLGPTRPGWKPFGTSHTFDDNGNQVPEDNLDGTPRSPNGAKTFLGWPIFMQTAPGVKFLVKVPKSEVNINLPSLFRFLLAHFTDLPQLRAYLESFFGGNFFEEYLMFAKFLIDKISKYCIVPGLDLYCHLNGKLISMGGELLVRVETSDIANPGSSYNTSNSDVDPCALRLKAQISLRELVEDIHSIMHTFKLTTDAVEGNRVQQQMRDEENLADDHLPAAVNDLFLFKQAAAGVDNASNKDNAVEAMSVSGMSTSGGRNVLSQSPSSHSPLNSSMKSSSGFFGSSNNSITNNNNNNNKVSRRQSRQSD